MKQRLQLFLWIGIVSAALGGTWLIYSRAKPDVPPVFPATINRDCAPWDGPAFTISIPYDEIASITISIWQSPSLALPAEFSFPDETMRIGTAYVTRELDPFEVLSGKVRLPRFDQGKPVEGRFSFTSARGERFDGIFLAEWGDLAVYCG
jgi:hypothetical protein